LISASAIITAAGMSSRMKLNTKKQYLLIHGIAAFCKAAGAFLASRRFEHVVITVPKGDISYAAELVKSCVDPGDQEIISLIEGGSSRQESVYLALQALLKFSPEIVLIHDGARPWISKELINTICEATQKHGACIPLVDIPDAVKKIDKSGYIVTHLDKTLIKGAQTPQGFLFSEILEAHRLAKSNNKMYPDDAEMYALYGKKVYTVRGEPVNRKLTYKFEAEEE
jgi:2-C-methyl-D-erythritol 4-phosphate cytidylyltransferase